MQSLFQMKTSFFKFAKIQHFIAQVEFVNCRCQLNVATTITLSLIVQSLLIFNHRKFGFFKFAEIKSYITQVVFCHCQLNMLITVKLSSVNVQSLYEITFGSFKLADIEGYITPARL